MKSKIIIFEIDSDQSPGLQKKLEEFSNLNKDLQYINEELDRNLQICTKSFGTESRQIYRNFSKV